MTEEYKRINELVDAIQAEVDSMQIANDIGELNMHYASAKKDIELLWGRKFQLIKAEKAKEV